MSDASDEEVEGSVKKALRFLRKQEGIETITIIVTHRSQSKPGSTGLYKQGHGNAYAQAGACQQFLKDFWAGSHQDDDEPEF